MLAGREFRPLELAKLCQRAERNFVGSRAASWTSTSPVSAAHSAVEIDCRSLGTGW
jgi:galactokinase